MPAIERHHRSEKMLSQDLCLTWHIGVFQRNEGKKDLMFSLRPTTMNFESTHKVVETVRTRERKDPLLNGGSPFSVRTHLEFSSLYILFGKATYSDKLPSIPLLTSAFMENQAIKSLLSGWLNFSFVGSFKNYFSPEVQHLVFFSLTTLSWNFFWWHF